MIERSHLAIVQEVDRRGSLTAAADVLCLTQSALSHSMRKLEDQLGTPIWLREGRSLRLTQAGQYLLSVANRVLPQFALAEERIAQFAQGARGTLRIYGWHYDISTGDVMNFDIERNEFVHLEPAERLPSATPRPRHDVG